MPNVFDDVVRDVRIELSRFLEHGIFDPHRFGVSIDGIEATQTIQYYHADQHLTDPAARGADNGLPLAAYKPAWVRTYLRSGAVSASIFGVTGRLTIERRRLGFLWDTVATLTPQAPGSVTARANPDYATERGSTFNSLNFVIPAAQCAGVMRLTVTVTDAAGSTLATSRVVVHANLIQTLRLRGILVAYNGPSTANRPPNTPPPPNVTIAAPTLANLQATAARSLLAMPVQSTGSFAVAGTITCAVPLDDPRSSAGGCSNNWSTLLGQLATVRTNDGNRGDVVYYGLLPLGIPLGVPGCGNAGLGSGRVGDQQTLMHEIGHGYGFQHTPCGAAGATDPGYPTYAPYASASIGEYGLDISTGTIYSPQGTKDYMCYCVPQWMSLYQHQRLVGHERLVPSWLNDNPVFDQYDEWRNYIIPDYIPDPPPDPWQALRNRADPVISIIGVVRSEQDTEVTSVARVNAVATPPGRPTAWRARLLGANGRELASAPLYELPSHGGGCGCGCSGDETRRPGEPPYTFQAMIPDVGPGVTLAIGPADRIVWERSAPAQHPRIDAVQAESLGGRMVRLSWYTDAPEPFDAWVQWSTREQPQWHGLAVGITGMTADVSLAGAPSGQVLLRVLVHDGFFTAVSEPVAVDAGRAPPSAAILSPTDGQRVLAGGPLRLWAALTDSSGMPLSDDAAEWLVDGKPAGRGRDVWITTPPAGEHRVTLIVRAAGDETQVTAHFITLGTDHDPTRPPHDRSGA
jgi:hypothetical protein